MARRIAVFLIASLLLLPGMAFASTEQTSLDQPLPMEATDDPALAIPEGAQMGDPIPGSYLVQLRPGQNPRAAASRASANALHVWEHAVTGFAARLDAAQVEALRRDPAVLAIEQDRVVTGMPTQNMNSSGQPWGLDRIDQRSLPLSRTYTYNATGAGVYAYIIDTGIQTSHPDFGGRAANVYDAFGGNGQDCHGHGTHVAGTVGGNVHGVAKQVQLRGMRVLNCSGSGSISGIVSAVNWLRQNHVKPAVANMSLGGGRSTTLDSAVNNLSQAGVFVAVAAGNSNANACNFSPAAASQAYTTAASASNDSRASFSNFGSCVDGYAPGVTILSAWIGGGTRTASGTSMASPHVAGVAALRKSYGDASSNTITNWINSNATTNVISGNRAGTPNRLLFKATL